MKGSAMPKREQSGNQSAPLEERVRHLLSQMTLEEKVAQIHLAPLRGFDLAPDGTLSIEPDIRKRVHHGIGAFRNVARKFSAADTVRFSNAIQRFCIEETRLGIPALIHEECLHGLLAQEATVFPQAIGLAGTFNPELVERVFAATAQEASSRGIHQAKTPVLDLATDPRWGRVQETYGEDPYLTSRIGLAAVKGMQGTEKGTIPPGRIAAMLKHYVGYGQSIGGRNFAPSPVMPRELRDVYLRPFEVCIREGGVLGIMPSHNEIDGIPGHCDGEMLEKVLRGELDFEGVVLSDYDDVYRLHCFHRVAPDRESAACMGITAGVDIEQPGTVYPLLVEAVKNGRIKESVIDKACARVLALKFRLGLFENPYRDPNQAAVIAHCEEHRALAKEAADQSIVLLKNDGVLPLFANSLKKVAVIGPNADIPQHGGYSARPFLGSSVLQGVREKLGATVEVSFAQGCRITERIAATYEREGDKIDGKPRLSSAEKDTGAIDEAVRIAKDADVVVLCLGGNEFTAKEATFGSDDDRGDRENLELLGAQSALVEAIAATGTPIVSILFNGRPLDCAQLRDRSAALLEAWFPGECTGESVADILMGDVNPSAKLPITFPRTVGQVPMFYNQKPSGYHKKYLFGQDGPLFPFGFGLSYTTFEYGEPIVDKASISVGESIRVSVSVGNTGTRRGVEIVQFYLRDEYSSVTRPLKELCGFRRVALAPGETRNVEFVIGPDALSFTGKDMKRTIEPGSFVAMVGPDSERLKGVKFEVR